MAKCEPFFTDNNNNSGKKWSPCVFRAKAGNTKIKFDVYILINRRAVFK